MLTRKEAQDVPKVSGTLFFLAFLQTCFMLLIHRTEHFRVFQVTKKRPIIDQGGYGSGTGWRSAGAMELFRLNSPKRDCSKGSLLTRCNAIATVRPPMSSQTTLSCDDRSGTDLGTGKLECFAC